VLPLTVHALPSAHPRTVPRQSAPPANVPTDEFLDEQRTILHVPKRPTGELVAEPPELPLPAPPRTNPEVVLPPAPAPPVPSDAHPAQGLAVNAPIGDVLDDLDAESSVPPPAVPRPRSLAVVVAILLLVAALGAAAVFYFALPYFT